jgi:hypothetical protein
MSVEAYPMTVLSKAAAMLAEASPDDLQQMTPLERAKFVDLMRSWWTAALRAQHPLNPNAGAVAARAGEHAVTRE